MLCVKLSDPFPISQVSPQAAGYLVKYVVDSIGTDGATSSGPHGISLSTTMDDDVFMDGTLREVEEKTPDSQDEVSERLLLKVSPRAVRQEVSQAISDKKGTLIILKEAEYKEIQALGEKEEAVPREVEADQSEITSSSKEKQTVNQDNSVNTEAEATVAKTLSPNLKIKTDHMTHVKGVDSPKKAMASWISEEVTSESSEVNSVSASQVKEQPKVQTEQASSSPAQITLSESVVLYENYKQQLGAGRLPSYLHHQPQLTRLLPPLQQQPTRLTAV